jgi:dipeptidyl aminopeptidase/acylaminoacyl peptidase
MAVQKEFLMDYDMLQKVAWLGEKFLSGPPRAIVMEFHGLGMVSLKTEVTTTERAWAEAGALVIFPCYGPWSWMNRQARAYVDDMVEAAQKRHGLQSAPLISTGGSMGGCSCLLFCRYTRHRVTACSALFPVCDVPFHFTERPDLPRTFRQAFWGYPEPFAEVLKEHSPLHQVAGMPDIPYQILHGEEDEAVNKTKHSDPFVAAMRKAGRKVEYVEIPGLRHNDASVPLAALTRRIEFVSSFL